MPASLDTINQLMDEGRCSEALREVEMSGDTSSLESHRNVIRAELYAAEAVIDEVDLTAEIGVPREPRIILRQALRGEMKVVARNELHGALRARLRGAGRQRNRHERATNHSARALASRFRPFTGSPL